MTHQTENDDIEYSGVRVRRSDLARLSLCAAKLKVSGENPSEDDDRWSHDKVVSRALESLERELAAKLPEPTSASQPSSMAAA